ncbi:hypothetical protein F2Q70_00022419 [Brassica cretica]|uniref:Uncharacterized protein n=1 Tax=Brassica cretica TaxID=69181 RepID=A0A3N6QLU7_BRACR|nr:hypothetical protein F2Q70_00022419 [Brassica cretica]KAF3611785.1 hypothetical protein DY000_02048910 [Brassica cretica]
MFGHLSLAFAENPGPQGKLGFLDFPPITEIDGVVTSSRLEEMVARVLWMSTRGYDPRLRQVAGGMRQRWRVVDGSERRRRGFALAGICLLSLL